MIWLLMVSLAFAGRAGWSGHQPLSGPDLVAQIGELTPTDGPIAVAIDDAAYEELHAVVGDAATVLRVPAMTTMPDIEKIAAKKGMTCTIWVRRVAEGSYLGRLVGSCVEAAKIADPGEPDRVVEASTARLPGTGTEPLEFTRLMLRDADGNFVTATDNGDLRLRWISHMEQKGYDAGYDQDTVLFGAGVTLERSARYKLGGVMSPVSSTMGLYRLKITTAVEWRLLDASSNTIVFTKSTTGTGFLTLTTYDNDILPIIDDALDGLLTDPEFIAILKKPVEAHPLPDTVFTLKKCPDRQLALPGDVEAAMDTVLVVTTGAGTGSGVLVSSDGYALTAAHVTSGAADISVKLRSGVTLPAELVRADTEQDIALIKIPGSGYGCLALGDAPKVGSDVFAIGSPAGDSLSFSVSKGVVSGMRTLDEWAFIQTDASISPGYSGGPLIDATGRIAGIVSFKIVAPGFEGVGFGVPASAVRERLRLEWGP